MVDSVGRSIRLTPDLSKHPSPGFKARLFGWAWASLLKLLCLTWRKRYDGFASIDASRKQGHKFLLCFWHGKYIPIMALCRWAWIEQRSESACVFTSLSARGAVISEICRHFGLDCILIPDGGNKYSYQLMRDALACHDAGVIAVDGPLGPYRQVKQGAVRLASELGFHLVPASVYTEQKWVVTSRWDRMEVPKPLSRTALMMGEPVPVGSGLSREEIGVLMHRVEANLESLEQQAEGLFRNPL
jgi:hypothetical protein